MNRDLKKQLGEVFDFPNPKRKEQFFRTAGIGSKKSRTAPIFLKIAPAAAAAAAAIMLMRSPAAAPPPRESGVSEIPAVTESVSPEKAVTSADMTAPTAAEEKIKAAMTDEREPVSTAQAVSAAEEAPRAAASENKAEQPRLSEQQNKTDPPVTAAPTEALPVTTQAENDPEGDEEYMKKYTAVFTAMLTFAGLLPSDAHAAEWKEFSKSDMNMIETYGTWGSVPDLNENGQLDFCDMCEYWHYNEVYEAARDDAREKYGYSGLQGAHAEEYAEDFAVFGEDLMEKMWEAMPEGLEKRAYPVSGDLYHHLCYYLYTNGSLPTVDEVRAEIESYDLKAADGAEFIEPFCQYYEAQRTAFMAPAIVPTVEEEQIFAKFHSGQLVTDLNQDGVLDRFDLYDLSTSIFYLDYDQKLETWQYPEEFTRYIFANGDFNGDGAVDKGDTSILTRYLMYNGISVEYDTTGIAAHFAEIHSRYYGSEETPDMASSPASGDANCDGKTDLSDAVAVLQYIALPTKYPLTAEGLLNADVYGTGDGVDGKDALLLQMWDAQCS
ncbi:MAG: hypothetical protein IJ170_00610 [Ruminococcus sp.]|nr:hypothetical protein [Ruminococcus sp.]